MALFRVFRRFTNLSRRFSEMPNMEGFDIEELCGDKEVFEELDKYDDGPEENEPRSPLPEMNLHMVSYNSLTKSYDTSIIKTPDFFSPKRAIFIGIIGAFVPECTCEVIYEWARASKVFKERFNLENIVVITQNDPYVVAHLAKKLDYEDRIDYIADWDGRLNALMKCEKELELELGKRNHRYAGFLLYGKLQIVVSNSVYELFFTEPVHPIFMWQGMNHPTQCPLYFC